MSRRRKKNSRRPSAVVKRRSGPVLGRGQFLVVGGETYELTIPKSVLSTHDWERLVAEGWMPSE